MTITIYYQVKEVLHVGSLNRLDFENIVNSN